MSDLAVSVIVPCHDAGRTLPRLLEALRAQTLDPDRFEVLLAGSGLGDQDGARVVDAPADSGPALKRNLAAAAGPRAGARLHRRRLRARARVAGARPGRLLSRRRDRPGTHPAAARRGARPADPLDRRRRGPRALRDVQHLLLAPAVRVARRLQRAVLRALRAALRRGRRPRLARAAGRGRCALRAGRAGAPPGHADRPGRAPARPVARARFPPAGPRPPRAARGLPVPAGVPLPRSARFAAAVPDWRWPGDSRPPRCSPSPTRACSSARGARASALLTDATLAAALA